MATVCLRVLHAVRWYEVSRVLTVSSTLSTTPKAYRSETWCKTSWHISRRNFSLTRSTFVPNLSPILTKAMDDSKSTRDKRVSSRAKDEKAGKNSIGEAASETSSEVTVTYHRGLPRITVPLPSRKEICAFTLKPITHTVGDFIEMLKAEDRGIDRVALMMLDGTRIGSSNTIESLMEDDFCLTVNDMEYTVSPPLHGVHTMEDMEKLADTKTLVGQLYEAFQVREHHAEMERQVLAELEKVRLELEPMEKKLQELEDTARRKADIFVWTTLMLMSTQFSSLARLTWWEYSWDIMEPITYFITYATTMTWFVYFAVTRQEYMLPDVVSRRHLIAIYRRAGKAGLDLTLYNALKDRAFELENTLKVIRGPLYDYQNRVKQAERERSSSSSSRSPSSSPSSSPSPSPSPSPERSLPKQARKGIFPEKGTVKKLLVDKSGIGSLWSNDKSKR